MGSWTGNRNICCENNLSPQAYTNQEYFFLKESQKLVTLNDGQKFTLLFAKIITFLRTDLGVHSQERGDDPKQPKESTKSDKEKASPHRCTTPVSRYKDKSDFSSQRKPSPRDDKILKKSYRSGPSSTEKTSADSLSSRKKDHNLKKDTNTSTSTSKLSGDKFLKKHYRWCSSSSDSRSSSRSRNSSVDSRRSVSPSYRDERKHKKIR